METQTDEEVARVQVVMRSYKSMERLRNNFESHWNDVANFVWPEMRNTFKPGLGMAEMGGVKKTSKQLDSSPQLALNQFGAIMDSLNTPRNQTWHGLKSNNTDLNKDREVELWFEQVNRLLFDERYAPGANFASQNQLHFKNLGAFGTGIMYVDQATNGRGLRYKSIGIGECFIRENHQGIVDSIVRYYTLEGYQALKQFSKEDLGEDLWQECHDKQEARFAFMQYVRLNDEFDGSRKDRFGKIYSSTTINVDRKKLVREAGYNTFPFIVSRYEQAPTETYGRSPAMMALPAVRTLNSQKSTQLKQGHRSADPVLLTHDDGILDMDLTPGALNPGGVDENGKLMVQTLPTGNFQIGKDMMDQEREAINAAFLVHLFQILIDTPRMTATEVIERTREKGILLAPTVGRQQSEYLGPLIDREIDLLVEMNMLPPRPQALLDAGTGYAIKYNSPLSRAMRMEEAAGVIRTVEHILPIVQTTQDPSPLDNFDMDVITRELSDINAVPENWMRSLEEVEAIRENRAKDAERAAQAAEAPGQAALMNAEQSG